MMLYARDGGVGRNVHGINVLPTASPGQARERMYFIHTNSSRAMDVTVLEGDRGGRRGGKKERWEGKGEMGGEERGER